MWHTRHTNVDKFLYLNFKTRFDREPSHENLPLLVDDVRADGGLGGSVVCVEGG
jgi:hypothetical protein